MVTYDTIYINYIIDIMLQERIHLLLMHSGKDFARIYQISNPEGFIIWAYRHINDREYQDNPVRWLEVLVNSYLE